MKTKYRFYIHKDEKLSFRIWRKDPSGKIGRQWSWTWKKLSPNARRAWFDSASIDMMYSKDLVEISEEEALLIML